MKLQGSKSDVTFLVILLAISLGLNVYLGHRVLRQPPSLLEPPGLAQGTFVPPLEVTGRLGETRTIDYSSAEVPTVLYFFSPSCKWCGRNLDNLKYLVAEKGDEYRFIGISIDPNGLEAYLLKNGLDFLTYREPSEESRVQYKLAGVPQTIVVSTDGEVLQSWRGAYSDDTEDEVEAFFEVELPGLREASGAEATTVSALTPPPDAAQTPDSTPPPGSPGDP